MKKLILFLSILFLSISLLSQTIDYTTKTDSSFFKKSHELKKVNDSYLIVKNTSDESIVNVFCEINENIYTIFKFQLSNLRIKIDSNAKKPYIFIKTKKSNINDLDFIENYCVDYVIITCDESDFDKLFLNNIW